MRIEKHLAKRNLVSGYDDVLDYIEWLAEALSA